LFPKGIVEPDARADPEKLSAFLVLTLRGERVALPSPLDPAVAGSTTTFAAVFEQQQAGLTPPVASPALMRDNTGRSLVAAG